MGTVWTMPALLQIFSLCCCWQFICVYGHEYKVDYNNQQQTIHINKDGMETDINYGDIVDIGNNRRIVYVGDGNWRQKLNPKRKQWPSKKHHYTAEQIDGWPQFVKTGFRVLDNQLAENEGFTDSASQNTANNGIELEYLLFIVSLAFICCCIVITCVGISICVGYNHWNIRRKQFHFDKLSSAQYKIVSDADIADDDDQHFENISDEELYEQDQ